MDALLTAFVATLLAGIGDRPARLCADLSGRWPAVAIAAGLVLAATAIAALAAIAGALLAPAMPHRATVLLTGVALVYAGVLSLRRARAPAVIAYPALGPVLAPALALFVLLFGEQAQFLAFATAARSGSPALAGTGAALGIVAATIPAILIGRSAVDGRPWPALRRTAGGLLIAAGLIVALQSLRLI